MAKSIKLSSGSLFCGSPITIDVEPETVNVRATFHRVKLEISAALSNDSSFDTYVQSAKAKNNETAYFDVSSALRSVASKFEYEYQLGDRVYPYLTYTLKAYDEYMLDGILHERVGEREYGTRLYALMGEFTEIERYLANATKNVQKFSRKPPIGEICSEDELLLYPTPLASPALLGNVIESGQIVKPQSLDGLSGLHTFNGHSVYVIPPTSDRIQFQFVNRLGVVESISACTKESLSYERTTETDTVFVANKFHPSRRIYSRKGPNIQSYSLSSGSLNLDWADWWVNEFLGCEKGSWVKFDGIWLPCEVIPEETTTVYDKANGNLCSIDFKVRLTLSGGYRNRL